MTALNCSEVREQLLEAEMSELRGVGDGAIAQHVAECESCRVYARRILSGYAELDRGLELFMPRTKRGWLKWAPLPLAAAAALALLLIREPAAPVPANPVLIRLLSAQQPLVTPPHDRRAIVMEHKDMTVVWLY